MLFIATRRDFIVNEENLTTVAAIIYKHASIGYDYHIGNCGCADSSKWYIHANLTDKRFDEIVKELKKIGTLQVQDRGRLYFERAGA